MKKWLGAALILIAPVAASFSVVGCSSDENSFAFLEGTPDINGVGTSSVSVSGFLPASANFTLKSTATQAFSIAASGTGTLRYVWSVDGAVVGGATGASLNLNGASFSPSVVKLSVTVADARGSVSHDWTVKVNAPPVISNPAPLQSTYLMSVGTTLALGVGITDPNAGESLNSRWLVDGSDTGATGTSFSFSPTTIQAGAHTVRFEVTDGPASDAGTWTVARTWTVKANFFYDGCNDMDNEAYFASASAHPRGYNRTCVLAGNASVGQGEDLATSPANFKILPTALAFTSAGDVFMADENNDVVWFWNRGTTEQTVVGVTVPAGQAYVVAGNGVAGNTGDGRQATLAQLNNPRGLAWDGTNLLISDFSNNRVRRVGPSGPSGAYVISALATTCSQPSGIAFVPTGPAKSFYVACFNSHVVRKIDDSTWVDTVYAGDGTAAGAPGDGGALTTAKIFNPRDLAVDDNGNLYISEWTGCRIRVINHQAFPISFYSGIIAGQSQTVTIAAGTIGTILGTPGSTTCANNESNNVLMAIAGTPARITNPFGIAVNAAMDGTHRVLGGIYVVNYGGGHRVDYLNLTDTDQVIGGTTVNRVSLQRLIGNGTGGYVEGGDATNARFNNPFDLAINPTDQSIWLADYSNYRVRKVNASTNVVSLAAGSGAFVRSGSAGGGQVYASADIFNAPRFSVYDPIEKKFFISDSGNHRIRSVNEFGLDTNEVGQGTSGVPASDDESPVTVQMNTPGQLALFGATATYGGHLIYADTGNHCIRLWNRSGTTFTGFGGISVSPGRVSTIAGICGSAGTATAGTAAAVAAFNSPLGVTTDGTDVYVSDTSNHCLKKVAANGTLSAVAGCLLPAGNTNGAFGVGKLNNPAGIAYMNYVNSSNASQWTKGILIADRSSNLIRIYKIAGVGPFTGQVTNTGDLDRVACGGTDHDENLSAAFISCSAPYGVAAVGTSKFCFSNSGYHNVRCVDPQLTITNTVMGAPQGLSSSNYSFLRAPFGASDQSGIRAFIDDNYSTQSYGVLWSPVPPLSPSAPYEPWGTLAAPWGVTAIDNASIAVVETSGGHLIRKIRLP